MNKRKSVFYLTIFGIIIIIIVATTIKYLDYKKNKKYEFVVNNIESLAKKCVREQKCKKENITLKNLYEKMNVDKFINPIDNKEFSLDSYVTINDFEFILK